MILAAVECGFFLVFTIERTALGIVIVVVVVILAEANTAFGIVIAMIFAAIETALSLVVTVVFATIKCGFLFVFAIENAALGFIIAVVFATVEHGALGAWVSDGAAVRNEHPTAERYQDRQPSQLLHLLHLPSLGFGTRTTHECAAKESRNSLAITCILAAEP